MRDSNWGDSQSARSRYSYKLLGLQPPLTFWAGRVHCTFKGRKRAGCSLLRRSAKTACCSSSDNSVRRTSKSDASPVTCSPDGVVSNDVTIDLCLSDVYCLNDVLSNFFALTYTVFNCWHIVNTSIQATDGRFFRRLLEGLVGAGR